ncbi:unnamed protein product [Notodromas monacha]|uniref:Ectonucleoside triphosphate diphosphohydrolase 5 n=1 Tax=Notodromas monacha TaxID=399045 RepID=A0A7R9GCG4_9CRUS|nr:unnamed protein product [Notodromas monacha]CAG0917631.1 unnamed protein product [Notodromas monacha]
MEVRNRGHSTSASQVSSTEMKRNFSMSSFSTGIAAVKWTTLLILVLTAVYCIVQFLPPMHDKNSRPVNTRDAFSTLLGLHIPTFAVVLDAGSTGSRVLAFSFFKSRIDGSLQIKDELFYEIKPGLSSFADDPLKGASTIKELLNEADSFVPEGYRPLTPLILRATAGLRLLPAAKAERLLAEVRKVFYDSGYVVQPNAVDIMDGSDEGIFSWFTINFLSGKLGEGVEKTAVTLDLGGGSTQITFGLQEDNGDIPVENVHVVNGAKVPIKVFTNSYLGLGLMSARKAILDHHKTDETNFASPCIGTSAPTKWVFNSQELLVKRSRREQPDSFGTCHDLASSLVRSKVKVPLDLNDKTINAISYFYDRAVDAQLIDPKDGGVIKLENFEIAARKVCRVPHDEHPFLCLDLSFIVALLKSGYGLESSVDIHLFKRINGHETSWALGAAYQELMKP